MSKVVGALLETSTGVYIHSKRQVLVSIVMDDVARDRYWCLG